MKAILCLLVLGYPLSGAAALSPEPILVRAVVQELKLSADSPPDDPGGSGSPPIWEVVLVINKVLKGNHILIGAKMRTFTSRSVPQGNWRVVIPKLDIGDTGIWALNYSTTGELWEVYDRYEVESGVYLPLIKGRHEAYEKVLTGLSGVVPTSENRAIEKSQQGELTQAVPEPAPPGAMRPPATKNTPEVGLTSSEEPPSSLPGIIIAVIIAAAMGILWMILKRRS